MARETMMSFHHQDKQVMRLNVLRRSQAFDGETNLARKMGENGRPLDGGPIKAGERFQTLTGRATTPYPRQKAMRWASQWLIDNAMQEARSRGDDFNATIFGGEKPLKDGTLAPAVSDSMLMYLFVWQPVVQRKILRPVAHLDIS